MPGNSARHMRKEGKVGKNIEGGSWAARKVGKTEMQIGLGPFGLERDKKIWVAPREERRK